LRCAPAPATAIVGVVITGPALDLTICLLARTSLVGILLFLLPPVGEFPPGWQVGLAFFGWIAWCYWRGLLGQDQLSLATVESIPSLWLSLKWTNLLVVASGIAARV
jgi:hypothetical protein